MPNSPTLQQLKRAVAIAEQIDALQAQLSDILGGQGFSSTPRSTTAEASTNGNGRSASSTKSSGKGKRIVSPETRAKMIAAQRARWKKAKTSESGSASGKSNAEAGNTKAKSPGGRRTISPEARARIAEAARKRWAAAKKAGKNSL